nr:uncharacterized protein LOC119159638 [Rhipicephalus microplus]
MWTCETKVGITCLVVICGSANTVAFAAAILQWEGQPEGHDVNDARMQDAARLPADLPGPVQRRAAWPDPVQVREVHCRDLNAHDYAPAGPSIGTMVQTSGLSQRC